MINLLHAVVFAASCLMLAVAGWSLFQRPRWGISAWLLTLASAAYLAWSFARPLSWVVALAAVTLAVHPAAARDLDGRYANSPLKQWFDSLKSGKGLCCSDADGFAVSDPDWESKNGNYRVRIEGEWHDVPPDAVITEPNRVGRTMVWPIKGWGGLTIRCFMPGAMT